VRVIDRLFEYLRHHNLTPYNFERACGIANGYLKKQLKGKGTIGSEILEKITHKYRDVSLTWLVTGKGKMLGDAYEQPDLRVEEDSLSYTSAEHTIALLHQKIEILEKSLADKEKIIKLLEARIRG
jgi:hypothetical protein